MDKIIINKIEPPDTISNKVNICECFYLLYLSVMFFARGIGLYDGMTLYNALLVCGCILFGLKVLLTEHTILEYVWMTAFLVIGFLVYKNTGEKGLIVCIITMIGIKGVSIHRVFRTGAVVWTLSFICIMALTIWRIAPEKILMHNKRGFGYVICHGLGYPHPNVLHISYIVLIMLIMYCIKSKGKRSLIISTGLCMLGNLFVFTYSVSFTGFIGTTFYLVVNLYLQMRNKKTIGEKILLQLMLPLEVIFSIICPIIIKGNMYERINAIMHNRFVLSNYFLTQQPITLFGSRLVVPNYRYTMDCSYVYLLVQLGIIPFILIIGLLILLIRKLINDDKMAELAIVLSLCFAGVAEPFMFNLSFKNLIFLFAGEYLFNLSDKTQKRLPSFWSKKKRFIAAGGNKVKPQFVITDVICDGLSRLSEDIEVSQKRAIWVATLLGMIVSAVLCLCFITKPETVYIDGGTNENRELRPEYFSADKAAEIRKSGDIIYNHSDKKTPMYAYNGSTAKIEYIRLCVRDSVMVGMIIWLFLNIIAAVKLCRFRQKDVMQ